ncbi:unnamed protein product [Allacma fusca]|uniref:Uncharacterized protein n=1 Tax=Allacma fusca TaxID=39272 RepID=A0A8J2PCW8_9HEXA|nr:unnamed protein product [Allacma fusca]
MCGYFCISFAALNHLCKYSLNLHAFGYPAFEHPVDENQQEMENMDENVFGALGEEAFDALDEEFFDALENPHWLEQAAFRGKCRRG